MNTHTQKNQAANTIFKAAGIIALNLIFVMPYVSSKLCDSAMYIANNKTI